MVTRSQVHTVKVVIFTSLVWLLIDTIILMNIKDCPRVDLPAVKAEHLSKQDHAVKTTMKTEDGMGSTKTTAKPGFFKRILPAVFTANEPGDYGKAVVVPNERKDEAKEKFAINQFNLVASDMMSLNRTLRDVRMSNCLNKKYEPLAVLGSTSVIIVFHNEAWSTLLRTVHSIINRSPPSLLHEIILVDDASVRDFLGKNLDKYVAKLPIPVQVLRVRKRTGLIRARLRGAEKATGKVLTFLDSHCECTEGWLLPIMHEIYIDRTSVVCPVIDVIDDNNFQYVTGSDMTYGGFNWRLNFRWYSVPQRENVRRNNDRSIPLRTPTMAGGLFSINREYFYEIGSYDQGMDIWGAENLEMSFRVWMCGGQVLIATCSHVGHIFRKLSPYTWPGGVSRILNKNTQRTASVWMDEYADVFYKFNPDVKNTDMGDITDRQNLRKRLKCKSFKWYLENIYPESQMPVNFLSLGDIRSKEGDMCLDTLRRKIGEEVTLMRCHNQGGNQMWIFNKFDQIQQNDICLISKPAKGGGKGTRVAKNRCKWKSTLTHKWHYDSKLFVYTRDLALQSDDLAIVVMNERVELGNFNYAHDKWAYKKKKFLFGLDGMFRNADFCVDAQNKDGGIVYMFTCYMPYMAANQRWTLVEINRPTNTLAIRHISTNKCLTMVLDKIKLEPCNESRIDQQWIIKDIKWKDMKTE